MFAKTLRELRKSKGLTQRQLADMLFIDCSSVTKWETKKAYPDFEKQKKLAEIFGVSLDYLMGHSSSSDPLPAPQTTTSFVTYPVIGEVAAGYENIAVEDWEGDTIEIPSSYLQGRNREDFFVLRVKGDSMYPLYHEGDKVLVLKQSTMDYSGQIGVAIYDDEKATLKKVEYAMGENWMRFVPINPNHPTVKIENESLEHCRILGIPKLMIREINE